MDELIGPYQVLSLLGVGGMGEVYLAHDTRRDRDVALKLLPESLAHDAEYVARFRRESHAAAKLREPHVVPIHDYGEIDGRLFIDMRLVEGLTARELLAERGRFGPEETADLVTQVADALAAAHADGLVHRDIKPSNVLVTPNGFAYVVDFGIARSVGTAQSSLTVTGVTVGTLDYMAPERFLGATVDGRADVYSLACLAYELLTGEKPFQGDDLPALMYAHLYSEPPRAGETVPGLPPEVDAALTRSMAKSVDDRHPDAPSFASDLRAGLKGATSAAAAEKQATPAIVGSVQTVDAPVRDDAGGSPASAQPSPTTTGSDPGPAVLAPDGDAAQSGPTPPAGDRMPRGAVMVRPRALWITAATVVTLLLVVVASLAGVFGPGTVEVRLEPVGSTGPNPFLDTPSGTDQTGVVTPNGASGPVPGETPGLFAARPDAPACNVNKIVADLRADPGRASAWAEAQRIQQIDITTWLTGQNPVTLRADASATEYRYADSRAVAEPVVLQAGTAVLIDQYGTPVVKCFNGNPLATPPQKDNRTRYTGPAWPTFAETRVTIVARAPAPLTTIVVINQVTGRTAEVSRPDPAPGPYCTSTAGAWICPPLPDPSAPPAPGCTVAGAKWSCPADPTRAPPAGCSTVGDRWLCTPALDRNAPPRVGCEVLGNVWSCPRVVTAQLANGTVTAQGADPTGEAVDPACAVADGTLPPERCRAPGSGTLTPYLVAPEDSTTPTTTPESPTSEVATPDTGELPPTDRPVDETAAPDTSEDGTGPSSDTTTGDTTTN